MELSFDSAAFCYSFQPNSLKPLANSSSICQDWSLNHSDKTELASHSTHNRSLHIVGVCVDSLGEISRNDIPEVALLNASRNVIELYSYFDRFAGRYVVFYQEGEDWYVWGDATCSLPIHYMRSPTEFSAVASHESLLSITANLAVSSKSLRIRGASSSDQPMPFDLSMFDSIGVLLPNHILDLRKGHPRRVPIFTHDIFASSQSTDVVTRTFERVQQIAKSYASIYDLNCALTSGRDSRLNLSFLLKSDIPLICYVFQHAYLNNQSDDICVPRKIASCHGIQIEVLATQTAPAEFAQQVSKLAGPYADKRSVDLAFTYRSRFPERALLTGDIVDQIGKSLLGNSVPNCLSTPRYFQCKIHNTSRESRIEISRHLAEMTEFERAHHAYDLFAWESRCARWSTQAINIYSLCGITSLNLYNLRSIIQDWLSIPRQRRKSYWLHTSLFEITKPELLFFPFNPSSRTALLKKYWPLFYIATFVKQTFLVARNLYRSVGFTAIRGSKRNLPSSN